VPEHELVEMAVGGLDYSIRKTLDTQYLRDMAELADRVRQVERLKAEKSRTSKFSKKEKVAYVDTNDNDPEFDLNFDAVENSEVNFGELIPGPPYTCKVLRPYNGKNPEEPKKEKYPSKTYSFDVTKSDEIFYLLVNEGIIVVPKGLKMPPIEQWKKMSFCKFHGYLGHNTSRCVSFRDSLQKSLDEGRLKFGDKSNKPMQIDANPLKQADSMFVEVADVNTIEVAECVAENFGKPKNATNYQKNDVEMATKGHICNNEMVTESQYAEKIKVAYPISEEDLVDFLKRCKISNSTTMLCSRCSGGFDNEAARKIEGFKPQSRRSGKWVDKKSKTLTQKTFSKKSQIKTLTPPSKSPIENGYSLVEEVQLHCSTYNIGEKRY